MRSISTCLVNYLTIISITLLLSISATAQLVPIPINGLSFNYDLIAEGPSSDAASVTSIAIGFDYVLYDETFKTNHPIITAGGLPANGTIINSSDTWQLKPYVGNNALFFPVQPSITSASIYLSTPAKYSQVSLLTTSVNGPIVVNISITFSDATITDFGPFTVKNWLGGSPSVIQGMGAIVRSAPVVAQEGTPNDPRLYQLDLNLNPVDQLKNVVSIDITNTDISSSSTVAFFAASGIPITSLPITFSSLSAQYQSFDKKIVLNWEAETNINSSGFEVERSSDASVFTPIATVNPKKVTGTSNYSYTDYDLQNRQTWFYRIKEKMAGGSISYSKIIKVKTSAAASFGITQSGGSIHLTTTLPDKAFQYRIVNLNGSELKAGTVSSANRFSIDIKSLPSGTYILNVLDQTESRSMKFVK